MSATVTIRSATVTDNDAVYAVQRAAFGGSEEADLVMALMEDDTASPRISLLAWAGRDPVGHVMFSDARLDVAGLKAQLLAPLAVVPDLQRLGVGTALTMHGLAMAHSLGTHLVFVLGHPEYYPQHGFEPAVPHGIEPPYPIEPQNHDAWMVRELYEGTLASARGKVEVADAIMQPQFWRE